MIASRKCVEYLQVKCKTDYYLCWLRGVSVPNLSVENGSIILLLRHLQIRRGQWGFLHVRLIY
jgi:hypothetical protein